MKQKLLLVILSSFVLATTIAQHPKKKQSLKKNTNNSKPAPTSQNTFDNNLLGNWEAQIESTNPAIKTKTDRLSFFLTSGFWKQSFTASPPDGECTLNYDAACEFTYFTRHDTLFIEYKEPKSAVNMVIGDCEKRQEFEDNQYASQVLKIAFKKFKSDYRIVNNTLEFEGNFYKRKED